MFNLSCLLVTEDFSYFLLKLIRSKGKREVDVYKKAQLDRRHFSKIKKGQGYLPSKNTCLALAISLELSIQETLSLLQEAGYTLSDSILADKIVRVFIENKRYNLIEINSALNQWHLPLL